MSQNRKLLRRRKEHREVFEMIKKADLSIQVLDARFPHICRSKKLEDFAKSKGKQVLCCINKADLVPKNINEKWKTILSRDLPTVFISTSERQGTSKLRQQIQRLTQSDEILICVFGFPNVGKSSLINVLKGKKSAPKSPKAGFTRHLRTVRISPKMALIDTPGIAPHDGRSVEEEVFIGTISPEDITNPDLVCNYIFEKFKNHELERNLEAYLGISIHEKNLDDVLEFYAKRRGLIRKGGVYLVDEAARIIIRDFMSGKIEYYEDPEKLSKFG
jgi:ribosome biogenesis GTPase A